MNIINEIDGLRRTYELELQQTKDKLKDKIEQLDKKLAQINAFDYAKEYIETYEQSLVSLENIYKEWLGIQRKTKGISFFIDEYIKTLRYETIPRGQVEEFFAELVQKCRGAIIAVQKSKRVEDDIAPQKIFCQCLVNLRYIVAHGRELINETSLIEDAREKDSKKFKEDLTKFKDQLKKLSWKDLPCAKYINEIREELMKNYANIENKLIGKRLYNEGSVDYNFLMGFKEENISSEVRVFVKDILDVSASLLASTPIYFNPKRSNGALLIRANAKHFESEAFLDFITNIYFSFSTALPAKGLYFTGVEKTADAVIRSIESQVSDSLGTNYIFGKKVATDSSGIDELVKALMNEYTKRSNVYRSLDNVADIFTYNEVTPDNKHPMILCCINKYPFGFAGVNSSTMNDIKTLLERGHEKGIFIVLCQVNEQDHYTDDTPIFNPNEIKLDYIDINGYEVKYNGVNITTDITIEGFKANKFFKEMAENNKKVSASMSLEKLIAEVDKLNLPRTPFTEAVSIPVGNFNGEWFNLDFKTCSTSMFSLFLGKSGSGKSAFIHTMMLSAAYYYPPDELQFYLVDFKDKDNSPEFANYMQKCEGKNLFIPHVRYLSVKSKLESAMDLLNKMEVMVGERSKLISKLKKGIPDINEYNKREEVRSGKFPKIPFTIFVIDEYKTMLDGGADASESSDYMVIEKISSKLQNLMTRLRAFGIGIIFLGHDVASGIRGTAFDQISTRLAFNMGSEGHLRGLYNFGNDYDAAPYYATRLVEKGNAMISSNGGATFKLVRMAYAGETGGPQQLRIAEIIREKYKDNPASKFTQVEAGSEELTPITEFEQYDDAVPYIEREPGEGKYYIPLGVSSASSIKMSLGYSTSKQASNYIAYAGEFKLFNIEQNAIFGFINKGFKNSKIYYASTARDIKKFMMPFEDVNDKINKHVEFISGKTETAKKLIALKRLYDARSIEAEQDDVDFPPVFMVLHDISWLTEAEGDPNWLPQNLKEVKGGVKTEVNNEEVSDISNTLSGMGLGSEFGGLANLLSGVPAKMEVKDDEDDEIFTLNDVKNALFTLHKTGNQFGIFLLTCAIKPSAVQTILDEDKDDICKKYMVYGSFDLYTDKSTSEDENCIYLLPAGSKTRLFDYDPEYYSDWWDKI